VILHNKATRLRLRDFSSIQMRAFHVTWASFFLCFFGWFGLAPLMPVVRDELHLTKDQVGNSAIAAVAITILARLIIGWLCDRIGPRKTYSALLLIGSLPVMGAGLAHDYTTFLIVRLAIGAIGASFVITQYHTSVMFAPNIVGTANATAAGWGNLGGGVTQMVMPLLFTAFVSMGAGAAWGWRLAMFVPGLALFCAGLAYYFLTKDTADGNFDELRAKGQLGHSSNSTAGFWEACRDRRVWALCALYGCCFGMELTFNNYAALYFTDYFQLSLGAAGFWAGTYGAMNLFARPVGGMVSDRVGLKWGLRGRAMLLSALILAEGLGLMLFARQTWLPLAVGFMMVSGIVVQMSNGATYSLVPFVNKKAIGAVAGIVGAGGNLGAVLAGFLFKSSSITWPQAILILGGIVAVSSVLAFAVRFSEADEAVASRELQARLNASMVPVAAGD
jgi:NNP family nitrate/nitrite transporter-like MFS transporter